MTFVPAFILLAQKPVPALLKPGVAETIAAGQAVAAYELAPWRKLHPKADLALTFTNLPVKESQTNAVRKALGLKTRMPVLDATVLTLVFGGATRPTPKRLSIEAYVFRGSFPKGFRANYLLAVDGKTPRVLSRTILDQYEVTPAKPNT